MGFPEILRRLRTDYGLSRSKLSEQIGISSNLLAQFEEGTSEPNLISMKKIADFFNVSFEHLLGYKVDIPNKKAQRSNYNKEIKRIPIIRVTTDIGSGTETDPFRLGFEYWDMDGKLLFITEAEEKEIKVYKVSQGLSRM